jgi:hypothetical protein
MQRTRRLPCVLRELRGIALTRYRAAVVKAGGLSVDGQRGPAEPADHSVAGRQRPQRFRTTRADPCQDLSIDDAPASGKRSGDLHRRQHASARAATPAEGDNASRRMDINRPRQESTIAIQRLSDLCTKCFVPGHESSPPRRCIRVHPAAACRKRETGTGRRLHSRG